MEAGGSPEPQPFRPAAPSLSIPLLKLKAPFVRRRLLAISTELRKHLLHGKKNKAAGVCRAKRYPAAERGRRVGGSIEETEKGDGAGGGQK